MNEKYELLKQEFPTISEMLKQLPEDLQERGFEILVSTLLGTSLSKEYPKNPEVIVDLEDGVSASATESTSERSYVQEFREFYAQKTSGGKLNDQEFSILATYYFTKLAPRDIKVDGMTEELLEEAFSLVSLKKPADIGVTFRNAKSRLKAFDRNSNGTYKLTRVGENFVTHDLPKQKKGRS